MKKILLVITALLLILSLSLAACRGDGSAEVAPAVAGLAVPIAAETGLEEAVPAPAPTGDPVAGAKLFASACSTCHGLKGEGVQGLSTDMTQSELIASKTDQELVELIKLGGVPGEPLMMPPRGGSPLLTDEDLLDLVAYIRSL